MSTNVFYVETQSGAFVQAQFLQINGNFVVDPNAANAENTAIYADSFGATLLQNTNGYLIVPANYNVSAAISEGQALNAESLPIALAQMYLDFRQGGTQDLQRTYDGSTNASYVSAFTDAASFNLGAVSFYAGISLLDTLAAGGIYTVGFSNSYDNDGMFFNTAANARSIVAGYNAALQTYAGSNGLSQDTVPQIVTNPDGSISLNFYSSANSTALTAQYLIDTRGASQITFYNNTQSIIAQQFINTDGSGSISADGQLLTYTPQDVPSVSFTSSGSPIVTITSDSGAGTPDTFSLSSTGVTADIGDNSFSEAVTNTQVVVNALGDATFLMPASTATGLSQTVDVTSDGISVLDGGNTIASAPTGSAVTTDSSGDVSFSSTPVASVTETTTVSADGASSVLLTDTNSSSSFTISESSDASDGLLTPTLFDLGSTSWTASNGVSLGSYLDQTINSTDDATETSMQTQTQNNLTAEDAAIDSGNVPSLPSNVQPVANSLIADAVQAGTGEAVTANDLSSNQSIVTDINFGSGSSGSGGSGGGASGGTDDGSGDWSEDVEDIGDDEDLDFDLDPLIFSLNGQGINLLSSSQSNAAYNGVHSGWVGSGTDILVLEGSNGSIQLPTFSSLATLDTNNDGIINSSDAGFSELYIWNDANGNGVVDAGELETLSQAGISSINLASTSSSINVGGNLITNVGSLTLSNGSTEAVDQVAFASQGYITLSAGNTDALSVLQQVASGNEASVVGSAAAIENSMTNTLSSLTAINNALISLNTAKPSIDGLSFSTSGVNIITATYQVGWAYDQYTGGNDFINQNVQNTVVNAPLAAGQSETAVVSALNAMEKAAQDVSSAAVFQSQADSSAVYVNSMNAMVGSTAENGAVSAADVSEAAWQTAMSDLVLTAAALPSAAAVVEASQAIVNDAVITGQTIAQAASEAEAEYDNPSTQFTWNGNNWVAQPHSGVDYATNEDALQAEYSFSEQQEAAQALVSGESAFQELLSAVGQAWNASSVVLATTTGQATTVTGGSLVVAAQGTETLIDGTSASTYVILPGATVTISNFMSGAGGSCLDFLSSGAQATVSETTNGTQISVGSSTVILTGVALSSLSLSDNLIGVGSIYLSGAESAAALSVPATIADIGASQILSIYGVAAAQATADAGQVYTVAVSDTGANVVANLSALP
ncbi:MAG: hypothetical protein P4L50_01750 [Anaerolineaceae bacterium]|nr:hypothetical protein [Alphaproteobacteria bacterium]MDR3572561.1 hypothetical protein [Anaerolineaceae bacterium]